MWTVDKTGSVLDENGKVIWFSQERFVRDIALGDCCFICGASPDQVEFNDEHVLPEWLLRRYDLFSRRITLPNGNTVNYGSYTVPCCKTCNSLMGEEIEKPISQLVAAGRDAVRRDIYEHSPLNFFVWLGLIYLKTHLKDRLLRFHLDERKGSEKIADTYDWDHLHHLHAVVRCFYTGSAISPEVIGSFMRLNVSLEPPDHVPFDYADLYLAQTMMLRLDDFAFITVLADAGCALRYFNSKLQRLNGPLNFIQLREVMAEITAIRLHMKTPPTFRSHMDLELEHHLIYADAPDKELQEWDPEVRGRLLYNSLQSMDPVPVFARYTEQEAMELIRAGKMTFLFDDAGNFLFGRPTVGVAATRAPVTRYDCLSVSVERHRRLILEQARRRVAPPLVTGEPALIVVLERVANRAISAAAISFTSPTFGCTVMSLFQVETLIAFHHDLYGLFR